MGGSPTDTPRLPPSAPSCAPAVATAPPPASLPIRPAISTRQVATDPGLPPPARLTLPVLLIAGSADHPPALHPGSKTSVARAPRQPLLTLHQTRSETTGPTFGSSGLGPRDNDLTLNFAHGSLPVGERIILHGHVLDENARPVPNTLVEIWQANASGRYRHQKDADLGALDPNFGGCGRMMTDATGYYFFRTIKPGPDPWLNDVNAWRPSHIDLAVFGSAFSPRLITQQYFAGDPLIANCPIVRTLPAPADLQRLIAVLAMNTAVPMDCLACKFDIVLRGRRSTLVENRLART